MFALHTSSRSIEIHCEAACFHFLDPCMHVPPGHFLPWLLPSIDAAPLSPFRPTTRCQNRPKSNLKSTAVVHGLATVRLVGAEAHSHKNVRLLLNLGAAAQMYRPLCEIRDDMWGRLVGYLTIFPAFCTLLHCHKQILATKSAVFAPFLDVDQSNEGML